VAQNQNKRRRKRRGTQGGRIDTNRRASRPRSREEAKARARSGRSGAASRTQRADLPPTWKKSTLRGLGAAAIFAIALILVFKRPLGASLILGAAMLAFYIPAGYYIDLALWRKRERQRIRQQSR
jgi:hypothetical protein